ncbi:MAG: hypothetical protein EBU90_29030 [Proteobacteria bacterium]|nr:hypothetical protein [Pseudomonadota bacterium]NBP16702.1 hypothetical protein [bacterium]
MASGDFVIDDAETAQPVERSYFRDKAIEFQRIINALDATASEVDQLIGALPESALLDALIAQREELEGKKGQIKLVAEAVNFAANGLNQVGANLPTIQWPQTLGAAPLVIAGAGAAAIAAAAAIIIWGKAWIDGVNQRLRDKALIESVPEAQRGAVADAIMKTEAAKAQADASPLGAVAGIVKWIAIGAVAFFAYQAFQQYSGNRALED